MFKFLRNWPKIDASKLLATNGVAIATARLLALGFFAMSRHQSGSAQLDVFVFFRKKVGGRGQRDVNMFLPMAKKWKVKIKEKKKHIMMYCMIRIIRYMYRICWFFFLIWIESVYIRKKDIRSFCGIGCSKWTMGPTWSCFFDGFSLWCLLTTWADFLWTSKGFWSDFRWFLGWATTVCVCVWLLCTKVLRRTGQMDQVSLRNPLTNRWVFLLWNENRWNENHQVFFPGNDEAKLDVALPCASS